MKCNFINVKLKDRNFININKNKVKEIFNLSLGNNIIYFNYNENKEEISNQNLEISYYIKFIKKNIGKMIYEMDKYNKRIKIFNQEFISNNIKRAKIIIENKQYNLKEDIKNEKQIFKIKIKFIDNIINLNYIFKDCISLTSIYNFHNLITKYLKAIFGLFYGCSSLKYIDDISNWNTNNINDYNISLLFFGCSSLLKLPDISIWDISKVTIFNFLFGECSSLESLPDISKWNTINIRSLVGLFYKCKSLKILPDISKWNTSNVFNLSLLFNECSSLKELPDISKWNLDNVISLNCLFLNCSSLISLPDISKWNIFNSNIDNYISYLETNNYFDEEDINNFLELTSF